MKRIRALFSVVLAFIVLVVLASCGANVDTEMTIDKKFSGSRVLTCTLSNSDLTSYVPGGAPALEETIKKHIPKSMEYDFSSTEEGVTCVFEVKFSSLEDYKTKVQEIVGPEKTPSVIFENYETLFKKGLAIKEDFDSEVLLQWLIDGLKADGVVTYETESEFLSLGTTKLIYDGTEYSPGNTIIVDEMTKSCMSNVHVNTVFNSDDTYSRTVTFEMSETNYKTLGKELDSFMKTLVPKGGKLVKLDDKAKWEISFDAKNAKELIKKTNETLKTKNTAFSADVVRDKTDGSKAVVTVSQLNDASYFSDYSYSSSVTSQLELSQSYKLKNDDRSDSAATISANSSDGKYFVTSKTKTPVEHQIVLDWTVPFKTIRVDMKVSGSGALTRDIAFVLNKKNVEHSGKALEKLVKKGVGGKVSFSKTESDNEVEYHIIIKAKTAKEMADLTSAYLKSDATVKAGKLETGSFVTAGYFCSDSINFSAFLGDIVSEDGIEYIVSYPMLQKAKEGDLSGMTYKQYKAAEKLLDDFSSSVASDIYSDLSDDETPSDLAPEKKVEKNQYRVVSQGLSISCYTFSDGTSVIFLIVIGIFVLLLLAGGAVLLILRKKISAAMARKREEKQQQAQFQQQQPTPATEQYQAPQAGSAGESVASAEAQPAPPAQNDDELI